MSEPKAYPIALPLEASAGILVCLLVMRWLGLAAGTGMACLLFGVIAVRRRHFPRWSGIAGWLSASAGLFSGTLSLAKLAIAQEKTGQMASHIAAANLAQLGYMVFLGVLLVPPVIVLIRGAWRKTPEAPGSCERVAPSMAGQHQDRPQTRQAGLILGWGILTGGITTLCVMLLYSRYPAAPHNMLSNIALHFGGALMPGIVILLSLPVLALILFLNKDSAPATPPANPTESPTSAPNPD